MEIPKLDYMPNNMQHTQNITTGLTVDSKASKIGKDNHPVEERTFPKGKILLRNIRFRKMEQEL